MQVLNAQHITSGPSTPLLLPFSAAMRKTVSSGVEKSTSTHDAEMKNGTSTRRPESQLKLSGHDMRLLRDAREGRPNLTGPKRRTLVVILKYCRHDSEECPVREQAGKIIQRPEISSTSIVKTLSRPEKPTLPARPTHPFFLGRTSRQLNPVPTTSPHHSTISTGLLSEKQITSGSDTDRGNGAPSQSSKTTAEEAAWTTLGGLRGRANNSRTTTGFKLPGAVEAAWPEKDAVHVRGLTSSGVDAQLLNSGTYVGTIGRGDIRAHKKQKGITIQVPETEDILVVLAHRLAKGEDQNANTTAFAPFMEEGIGLHVPKSLRLPRRLLLKGSELQARVNQELQVPISPIVGDSAQIRGKAPLHLDSSRTDRHPALVRLYNSIGNYFTPFDLSICDTQPWTVKHAPVCADEVLQPGKEPFVLRDWLQKLALSYTDQESSGSAHVPVSSMVEQQSKNATRSAQRRAKRRRKREEELSNFIVSSEDESSEMRELSDPDVDDGRSSTARSVVRTNREMASSSRKMHTYSTNAMVISGPCGCGKTAAVYAVAKELAFEVFEINPGSRRNGKDLLERVGDMSRNHLVHHTKGLLPERNGTESVPLGHPISSTTDSEGDEGGVRSFFRSQASKGPRRKGKRKSRADDLQPSADVSTNRSHKQSLILLEEVDVLFEEDKLFWATVLTLLSQSKRPIILTCTDENLVPLDLLPLQGILRFQPPPDALAVDYLLLLAGAEGHLLERSAIETLYQSKHRDLRASITEIDFWCQMAVGDRKGGLEWMHPRCSSQEDGHEGADVLHVASKDTYVAGMGWSSADAAAEHAFDPELIEEELLRQAWNEWGIDVEDWFQTGNIWDWANDLAARTGSRSRDRLAECYACDSFYETLSSADIFAGHALAADLMVSLNPTRLPTTHHVQYDTVLGYPIIDVDPAVELDGLSTNLTLYVSILAKRLLRSVAEECGKGLHPLLGPFDEEMFIRLLENKAQQEEARQGLSRRDFSAAFDPITEPSGSGPSVAGMLQYSDFDRNLGAIVEDLAPYVRSIILRDMHLEEQRKQLADFLSHDGRGTKGSRVTRASRSALEGRDRRSMRRDQWFDGDVNPGLVLKTGSQEWFQAAMACG